MELYIVLTVVAIYLILTYNSLVSIKNNVHKAWANIDVLLKQRHDELPKLIDTCKAYMKHEQETLEKVMLARAGVDSARQNHDAVTLSGAETALRNGMAGLYAVAENYPDLKADQSFKALQSRITGLENAIADRREFYNDSANVNNVRIQQFPDLIVAKLFGFSQQKLLVFAPAELEDIDVSKRLNS
jgi:LemA protein